MEPEPCIGLYLINKNAVHAFQSYLLLTFKYEYYLPIYAHIFHVVSFLRV
jgi:hypothetical protein